MPHQIFVRDTITGECGLADPPCNYPAVVNGPLVGTGLPASPLDINFLIMSNADTQDVVTRICGVAAARQALAACLISADAGNTLVQGADNLLFVGPANIQAAEGITIDLVAAVPQVELGDEAVGGSFITADRFINLNTHAMSFQAADPAGHGANAMALGGSGNRASGARAFAASGFANVASGSDSLASGNGNTVSGPNSVVSGAGNTVSGPNSAASGFANVASGLRTFVTGSNNVNSGNQNVVAGAQNTVAGDNNIVGGNANTLNANSSTNLVVGASNTLNGAERNIIGGLNNTVSSNNTLTIGNNNIVTQENGIVLGFNHQLRGQNSMVAGNGNVVPAANSQIFIWGNFTQHQVGNGNNFLTGGSAAAGPAATANRRFRLNLGNGDLHISGALTAGFVFPGFGEHFANPDSVPQGRFVTTDDGFKVRPAGPDDEILGITRNELAMSSGGVCDPANSPWVHDEFGCRIIDHIPVDERGLTEEGRAQIKATREPTENEDEEAYWNGEWKDCGSCLDVVRPNPNYDPSKVLPTIGVELMGRCFVSCDGAVKANDWVTAGAGGIAVKSAEKTMALVMSVKNGIALVMLRMF